MSSNIQLRLPDGSVREVPAGTTGHEVAASIGKRLAQDALAVKLDGEIYDLSRPLTQSGSFGVITPRSREGELNADGLYVLRHSCAHVMAEAICRLWPEAKLVYGPPVEGGYYYDIDLPHKISAEEFAKIEAEMAKIVAEQRPFTRVELPRAEGMSKVQAEGNPYKVDNAQRAEGDVLSFYVTGARIGQDFEDLCRGPHVPHTGKIGAFKVTSVAGAYWHGDANQQQLQRVYGTAFPSQKDLDEHLKRIEESQKRDHRLLGKQLELFHIDEAVGQGLILWKPNGAVVRKELQKFIGEELAKHGYHEVFTPHIGKLDLYRTSGHFPYYSDSQYPPVVMREELSKLADEKCSCADLAHKLEAGEIDGYLLKPMNCPHHIKIYASQRRSYRELPLRLAEFGTVYRWEQSGELNGMTRVRGFTQDDAHLFCTEEQVAAELRGCLDLVKTVFRTLGMQDYRVRVGLRDPASTKYTGAPELWEKAEHACREAAKHLGAKFTEEPGEAAFYGPKIDFVVKDVIGREWQLGTVQVDYNLPQRFELSYIGSDNQAHRPVMIHRAPFGSLERFVGVLIEHFAGAFPFWLAPIQVRVANITDKQEEACRQVEAACRSAGLRVDSDLGHGKINAKVAAAEQEKIPYLLVVGEREAQSGSVAVRERGRKNLGEMKLEAFLERARAAVSARRLEGIATE